MSPQPIIDGERIVESGSTQEQFAYYRESASRNSIVATNFVLGHLPDRASVERTALGKVIPEFYTGDRVANIQFTGIDGSTGPGEYTYLSEPDTVTGVNTQGHLGFIFSRTSPCRRTPNRTRSTPRATTKSTTTGS